MFTRILSVFSLCLASIAVWAQNNHPANFDYEDSTKQLANLIKYPKEVSGKVSLILSCVSRVQASGSMKNTGCYQNNQYEQAFAAAVTKAAKKARMNPAIVDGKPAEIYLQFRIEFIREAAVKKKKEEEGDEKKKKKKDEKPVENVGQVHLYLNPGYEENVLEYGYEHIAGQRVIGKKEPWNDVCPNHARYSVWVRAYLSEEGKAESPTVEFGNGIHPIANCIDAIEETIIASRYTPAIAEGVPVPSTYIEVFSN